MHRYLFLVALGLLSLSSAAPAAVTWSVIGQPNLASTTLESRCAKPNARFH